MRRIYADIFNHSKMKRLLQLFLMAAGMFGIVYWAYSFILPPIKAKDSGTDTQNPARLIYKEFETRIRNPPSEKAKDSGGEGRLQEGVQETEIGVRKSIHEGRLQEGAQATELGERKSIHEGRLQEGAQATALGERKSIHEGRLQEGAQATELGERNSISSLSSPVNVYDVTHTSVTDTRLCIKTRTPTVYIICTYEVKEDIWVSGDIHRTGQWESDITKLIHDFLKQDRPITFIDIGANMGYFSLLAAAVGQPVVAVEPWKRSLEKIADSIRINGFQDKITLLNNAVSNDRHVVHIDVGINNNKGAARLVADTEKESPREAVDVNTILLDDIVKFIHTKDVVIKLDIEGHECRVLEKSQDLFNKFNVLLITMEWAGMKKLKHKPGVACPEQNIQEMVNMLTRRGFVPYAFPNGEQLDPNVNTQWKAGNVYWKPLTTQ